MLSDDVPNNFGMCRVGTFFVPTRFSIAVPRGHRSVPTLRPLFILPSFRLRPESSKNI